MAMGPNPNEGCVGRIARGRRIGSMPQPTLGLDRRDGLGTRGQSFGPEEPHFLSGHGPAAHEQEGAALSLR